MALWSSLNSQIKLLSINPIKEGSHPWVPLFFVFSSNLHSNFKTIISLGYLNAKSAISFNRTTAFSGDLNALCVTLNLQLDPPSPSCATTIYDN